MEAIFILSHGVVALLGVMGGYRLCLFWIKKQRDKAQMNNEELYSYVLELEQRFEELASTNGELHQLAITDDLTGLYNARYLHLKLKEMVKRCNRYGNNFAMMLIDLNDFKIYNDTKGHLAGDELLARFGEFLKQEIREDVDFCFRYGGDEFIVILAEVQQDEADFVAKRLDGAMRKQFKGSVTMSYGVLQYPKGEKLEDFFKAVDEAMYNNKRDGKKLNNNQVLKESLSPA